MRNAVIAVSGVLAVAVSATMPAVADNHAAAEVDPVELYICSLNEGKSMEDADKLDARYKKWADKNDKDYSALSLIHISEPTRLWSGSRMPSSA